MYLVPLSRNFILLHNDDKPLFGRSNCSLKWRNKNLFCNCRACICSHLQGSTFCTIKVFRMKLNKKRHSYRLYVGNLRHSSVNYLSYIWYVYFLALSSINLYVERFIYRNCSWNDICIQYIIPLTTLEYNT